MDILEIIWADGGTGQLGREEGGGGSERKGEHQQQGKENRLYPPGLASHFKSDGLHFPVALAGRRASYRWECQ